MMWIDIMTLFPDVVGDMLCESILGRGQERGFIRIECHQIRDYTTNKQNQVDDYPYGGGHGARHAGRPALSLLGRTSWRAWPRANGCAPSICPPAARPFKQADASPSAG